MPLSEKPARSDPLSQVTIPRPCPKSLRQNWDLGISEADFWVDVSDSFSFIRETALMALEIASFIGRLTHHNCQMLRCDLRCDQAGVLGWRPQYVQYIYENHWKMKSIENEPRAECFRINRGAKAIAAIVGFVLAAWAALIMFKIPRDADRGVGACLFVFGSFNLLLHRRHAKQFFNWSRSRTARALRVWSALGESGIKFLFLTVSAVLMISGIIFWLRTVF